MNCEIGTKINHILRLWPPRSIATASWLEKQGIGHQLRQSYKESDWISHFGHGAFIRAGDEVSWEGGLYAIQEHLHLPIHVAAKTALEWQGSGHFLPATGKSRVYIFGAARTKLPSWFKGHDWQVKLYFKSTALFSHSENLGFIEKKQDDFFLRISSRERAILELLSLVPQEQPIDEAVLIFESLRTLRPILVQQLLERCCSIKAKRLFLYFAELTQQPWFKEIDVSKIDLGKGKRVIGEGGVLNKYQLSMPKILVS